MADPETLHLAAADLLRDTSFSVVAVLNVPDDVRFRAAPPSGLVWLAIWPRSSDVADQVI